MDYSQPKSLVRHPHKVIYAMTILCTIAVLIPIHDYRFLIAIMILNSISLVLTISIFTREKERMGWMKGWLKCNQEYQSLSDSISKFSKNIKLKPNETKN